MTAKFLRSVRAARRRRPDSPADAGFTLIELLVVLAILALLAGVAAPQVIRYLGSAKSDTARVDVKNIGMALDLYRLDVGQYPSRQQGLTALVKAPAGVKNWNGPYLKSESMVLDPWGRAYQYMAPGQHGEFDLFTLGLDNAAGGTGENQDVTSW